MTVSDVEQFLFTADATTLARVSEVITIRRGHLRDRLKVDFRIGDRVWFTGRKQGVWKGTIHGTISKKNPKKCKVTTKHPTTGRNVEWTVPYTMLNKE